MKTLPQITNSFTTTRLWFWIIVVIAFSVYVTTVALHPVAYGDSDELTVSGFTLGVPHPPGYPVLNLLIFLVTHLIPIGSIAFRANLLAAMLQAITLGFIYLSSLVLLSLVKDGKNQDHPLLNNICSATSALGIGFSYLYWTYANVIEVFPLNNLYTVLLIYASLRLYQLKTDQWKWWYLLTGFAGLALAHQQLILLLLPGLGILNFHRFIKDKYKLYNRKQLLLGIGLTIATFTASFLLLFLFQTSDSRLSWNFQPNMKGLLSMITRQDYAGIKAGDGLITGVYFSGFYLPENIRALNTYFFQFLYTHLGMVLIILVIVGIYTYLKEIKTKTVRWGLLFSLLLVGPFIAFYIALPNKDSNPQSFYQLTGITERMYLMGYVVYAIFIPFALKALYRLTISSFPLLKPVFLLPLAVVFPISLVWLNYHKVNLRDYRAASDYAHQMLETAGSDSVLVCFSDISCFSLAYAQVVEQAHPKVTVVPVTYQLQPKYVRQTLSPFHYPKNPEQTANIISWSIFSGKKVFAAELPPEFIDTFGLDGVAFYLKPAGNLYQISCAFNPESDKVPAKLEFSTRQDNPQNMQLALQALIAQQHAANGALFTRMNKKAEAKAEIQYAQTLLPENQIIKKLKQDVDTSTGNAQFSTVQQCKKVIDFQNRLLECPKNDYVCYYKNLNQSIMAEPMNVAMRLSLAQYYHYHQILDLAQAEIENILVLEPTNPTALSLRKTFTR